MTSKRSIRIFCISVFLFLFAAYFIYHQSVSLVAADNTSMFQILMDFLGGNYLMKDWVVGTASFAFTDTIWCLPGVLLGIHVPVIMSACGAFFHAGMASIMLYLLLSDALKNGDLNNRTLGGLWRS